MPARASKCLLPNTSCTTANKEFLSTQERLLHPIPDCTLIRKWLIQQQHRTGKIPQTLLLRRSEMPPQPAKMCAACMSVLTCFLLLVFFAVAHTISVLACTYYILHYLTMFLLNAGHQASAAQARASNVLPDPGGPAWKNEDAWRMTHDASDQLQMSRSKSKKSNQKCRSVTYWALPSTTCLWLSLCLASESKATRAFVALLVNIHGSNG